MNKKLMVIGSVVFVVAAVVVWVSWPHISPMFSVGKLKNEAAKISFKGDLLGTGTSVHCRTPSPYTLNPDKCGNSYTWVLKSTGNVCADFTQFDAAFKQAGFQASSTQASCSQLESETIPESSFYTSVPVGYTAECSYWSRKLPYDPTEDNVKLSSAVDLKQVYTCTLEN